MMLKRFQVKSDLFSRILIGGIRFFLMSMVTFLSAQVKIGWTQAIPTNALPSGGQIQSGAARIDITGANMLIHQSTQRAAIDWKSFDVGRDASISISPILLRLL